MAATKARRRREGTLPAALAIALICGALSGSPALASANGTQQARDLGAYIVLGWNDLGMHCANKNFADLCVLPPFNNQWATIIQRGDQTHPPQIVGANGFSVTYAIEDNTYSVGKTDFWTYVYPLFGVHLPPNIGLTGNGLSGNMVWSTDHFVVTGVPLTPYTDSDLVNEQPYQLERLNAYDGQNTLLATTEIVAPISNELSCGLCHHANAGETLEHAILRVHDDEEGTNLVNSRPVLCASCHGSNALGLPGNPNLPNLSLAMHGAHAEETDNCYDCHPGPRTQCLRDVMSQHFGKVCQDCHGHVSDVANSIQQGRQPWRQEPRCETCHGANFAEQPNTLYRNSNNGHGGLYCPTCHTSPHAILPSREERDNRQNVVLQGLLGTLRRCDVCHGYIPEAPGPHGLYVTGINDRAQEASASLVRATPNPAVGSTEVRYRVIDGRPIRLAVYDPAGREVRVMTTAAQTPGEHTLVWDGNGADGRPAPAGVYIVRLSTGGKAATARVVKLGR